MIWMLPEPQEHDRTLRDIETLLPSLGVVKFHGLGWPRMTLEAPGMSSNELQWTWVGPGLDPDWPRLDPGWPLLDPSWTWVDPGWTWFGPRLTQVGPRLTLVGPVLNLGWPGFGHWLDPGWTRVGPGVDPNLSQMARLYNQSVPSFHQLVPAFNQLDRWVLKEFKRF